MVTTPLRQLIEREELLVAPSVTGRLTAKLAESIGFEAIYLGGSYPVSKQLEMIPESLVTMTELCNIANDVTARTSLPLIVDAVSGYGLPSQAYRMVREFADSGIRGFHIEDQVYPRPLEYHNGEINLVEKEKHVQRIRAAVDARDDIPEDMIIIARTDAGHINSDTGIDEAIERVNTYLDAGADVGIVFPSSYDELEYAAKRVDGPLMFIVVESREPRPTVSQLDELGYSMASYNVGAPASQIRSAKNYYEALFENGESPLSLDEANGIRDIISELNEFEKYEKYEE